MGYTKTDHYDGIIRRHIRSGRASNKTEVIHQALSLLDAVTRNRGPSGSSFANADELEALLLLSRDILADRPFAGRFGQTIDPDPCAQNTIGRISTAEIPLWGICTKKLSSISNYRPIVQGNFSRHYSLT